MFNLNAAFSTNEFLSRNLYEFVEAITN